MSVLNLNYFGVVCSIFNVEQENNFIVLLKFNFWLSWVVVGGAVSNLIGLPFVPLSDSE